MIQINNVFIHGYFKLHKKQKPKTNKITKYFSGNPLTIFFRKNSFTFRCSKDISTYLCLQDIKEIIRYKIEKTLEFSKKPPKLKRICCIIKNYQASCTLHEVNDTIFFENILPNFVQEFGVETIGLSQEANSPVEGYFTLNEILSHKTWVYLLLTINNITVKFQTNRTTNLLYITVIPVSFDSLVKHLFNYLNTLCINYAVPKNSGIEKN